MTVKERLARLVETLPEERAMELLETLEEERRARIRAGRGKFARSPLSVEGYHRRKQEEIDWEEESARRLRGEG